MLTQSFSIKEQETQIEFELLPPNIYQVELLDIEAKETETYDSKQGKTKTKELETTFTFTFGFLDQELKGRKTWANFIPSYLYISKKTGKNKLYQIVEALVGSDLSIEQKMNLETNGSDMLNSLVGKQCRIFLKHKETAKGTIAVPDSYLKADKQIEKIPEVKLEDIPDFLAP